MNVWKTLGLTATRDPAEIRRAYARRLKVTHPEDDPEGFQALRQAYEQAMSLSRAKGREPEPAAEPPTPPPPRAAERAPAGEIAVMEREIAALQALRQVELDALNALLDQLNALVAQQPIDSHEVTRLGEAVLSAPALEEIGILGQVDDWMQNFVAHNLPYADRLIEPAATRFGWRSASGQLRAPGAVEYILERADDLVFRRRCRDKIHIYRKAFLVLEAPPQPRSPWWRLKAIWGAGEVEDLLVHLQSNHRSLQRDLNQDSLTWWSQYLAGPRIRLRTVVGVLTTAVLAFLFGTMPNTPFHGGWGGGLLSMLAVAGVLTAAVAGWHYGVHVSRHRWLTEWRDKAPDWVKLGWAPAALAALVVAGMLPASLPSLVVAGVGAVLVWAWARAVSDEPRRLSDWADRIGPVIWINLFLFGGFLAMAVRFDPLKGGQMLLPLLVAGLVFVRGRETLARYWRQQTAQRQLKVLRGCGVVTALTAGALFVVPHAWFLEGVVAALALSLSLLARTPATDHSDLQLRYRLIITGFLVWVGGYLASSSLLADPPFDFFVASGLVLLLSAGLSMAMSAFSVTAPPEA